MIYYPKHFGVDSSFNRNLDILLSLSKEYNDKTIYLLSENNNLKDLIKNKNIKIIKDYKKLKENDIVVLNYYGESKNTYDYFHKNKILFYESCSTIISDTRENISEKYNQKYNLIIVGDKNSKEIINYNTWCNNKALIISDINDFKLINKDNYFIFYSLNTSIDLLNELQKYLNENNIDYEIDNTIYERQNNIEKDTLNLSKEVDKLILLGTSNYTKKLAKNCSLNTKVYLYKNINEFYEGIKKENFKNDDKIGISIEENIDTYTLYECSNLLKFYIYYKSRIKDIEKEINNFNDFIKSKDNKIIIDATNKFINMNSGGKYLRALLIDLGYKLNKDSDYALKLASSYEAFQTSILIHDDIIDNSSFRRGKETISYSYKKEFESFNSNDNIHNNLALCIGDLGFYYVNEYILDNYKDNKNFNKLFSYYNNIVINTIKGEILDVYLPFIEEYDKNHILKEEDIMEIYKLKTSHYSIVGPFVMGMILSGSRDEDIKEIESILDSVGIAFQIKDDILGIYSSNEILGKPVFSDIEEFKQTILYSYIKINKKDYLNELLKYYGKKDLNEKEAIKVQNIIEESGSLKYAADKMNDMFTLAKREINFLQINKEIKNILLGLIVYLELREK